MFETRITEGFHKSRKFIRRVGDSYNYITTSHAYQMSYEKPYVTHRSPSIDVRVRKLRIPRLSHIVTTVGSV